MVNGARFLGVTFLGKDNDTNMMKIDFKGNPISYELLQTIEFNSTRKRMTSILRAPNGEIIVMCKGADSILLPLLKPQIDLQSQRLVQKTIEHMDGYARIGLRTLLIVEKRLTEHEYQQWNIKYQEANNSLSHREEKLE